MDNFFGYCKKVFGFLFERVSDFERTQLVTHLNPFGFSFQRVWLLVPTRLACRSNKFWLLVWICLAFHLNAFHTMIECIQAVEQTHSYLEWTCLYKNTLYLVPDRYCIWCSSIDKLDIFKLFIDRQHYFSSFKLLRHSSHFAKILFNQQRDYCACAIKSRLCSYNRGFI